MSGECQVNVRWMSGECQISIWAWHWWTWNLLNYACSIAQYFALLNLILKLPFRGEASLECPFNFHALVRHSPITMSVSSSVCASSIILSSDELQTCKYLVVAERIFALRLLLLVLFYNAKQQTEPLIILYFTALLHSQLLLTNCIWSVWFTTTTAFTHINSWHTKQSLSLVGGKQVKWQMYLLQEFNILASRIT